MTTKFRKVLALLLCTGMISTSAPAVYAEETAAAAASLTNTADDGHIHTGSKEFVRIDYIEPTCTTPSMDAYIYICEKCGEEYPLIYRAASKNYKPSLGHDLDESKGIQTVDGECGTYQIGHCKRCGRDNVTVGSVKHSWSSWSITEKATCKDTGLMERECSKCKTKETSVLPKLTTHTWGEWEITRKADCNNDEIQTRECSVCGEKETKTTSAVGHKFSNDWITVPATCTEEGCEYRVCTVCGAKDEDNIRVIAKKPHTPEIVDDCTKDVHCTVCGELVSEGKTHDFSEEWSYDNDKHFHKCLNEGCTVTSEEGSHSGKYIMGDCTMGVNCEVCGAKAVGKHESHDVEGVEVSTFTFDKHIYRCKNEGCVTGITEEHIAAEGRDDCTSPIVCGKCGATIQEGQRSHNYGTYKGDYEPTEEGHIFRCKNIGCIGEKIEPHTFVAYGDKGEICSGCGYVKTEPSAEKDPVISRMQYSIKTDGKTVVEHTHTGSNKDFVRIEIQQPTCTLPEREVTIVKCETCGEEFPLIWRTVKGGSPALGHDIEDPVEKENACGSYKEGICTRCGEYVTSGSMDHNWGSWTIKKAATCKESGIWENVCTKCGKTETYYPPKLTTHTWGEWEITRKADCNNDEIQTRECSVCGEKETKTTSAVGHKFSNDWITVPATCTEEGCEYRVCTVCGAKDEENIRVIAKIPHTPEIVDDCTKDVHCTVCGELVSEGKTHDFSEEWSYDNDKHFHKCLNEGCTVTSEEGSHSGKYIMGDCTMGVNCEVCGAKAVGKHESHDVEGVEVSTFTFDKHIYRCKNEGCVTGVLEEHIAAEGRDDCTSPIVCEKCGATIQEGQRSHNYGTYKGDYEPTEEGHYFSCLNKGCKGYKIEPHDFVINQEQTEEVCSICGYSKEYVPEIPDITDVVDENTGAGVSSEDGGKLTFKDSNDNIVTGDVELTVSENKEISEEENEAVENLGVKFMAVYDITLSCEEAEVQPEGKIIVTVPVLEGMDGSEIKIFRQETDGTYTDMEAKYDEETNSISFVTEHLSVYVIVKDRMAGDVNRDDEVNDDDISAMKDMLTANDAGYYVVGDLNNDGSLDIRDLSILCGMVGNKV